MNECRDVQRAIWSGEVPISGVERHAEGCAACGVELRRARELQQALCLLEHDLAVAPSTLEPALMEAVRRSRVDRARQVVYQPRFWRGAAVGAAAATAAAFGVIVARRLARPEIAA